MYILRNNPVKKLFFLPLILLAFVGKAQPRADYWFSNINDAKAYATEHKVPILMVFAGSDWCRPCMQFKQDILKNPVFEEYAADHMAVLYLDFPIKKANKLSPEQTAHNEKLADKYNKSGAFPSILLIDADENILGPLHFENQTPEAFIASFKALLD